MSTSDHQWASAGGHYLEHIKNESEGITATRIREACLFPQLLKRIASKNPSVVLDAGCGEGWLQRRLRESNAHPVYYGLDVSIDLLLAAREQNNQARSEYACGSLETALPF